MTDTYSRLFLNNTLLDSVFSQKPSGSDYVEPRQGLYDSAAQSGANREASINLGYEAGTNIGGQNYPEPDLNYSPGDSQYSVPVHWIFSKLKEPVALV